MSATFKVKNKKVDKKNNKILETLDSKHMEMVKELDSFQRKLPDLEKELEMYQLKLKRIQENIKDNSFDVTSCAILDDNLYTERYTVEETISSLTKEIEKIKNNEYINDYFLKTGHLLYDYYDGSNTLGKEFQTKGEETTSSSDIDDDDLLEDTLESDDEEDQ